MPTYKRLIAQVHDIDADSPAQADDIARLRAKAVNEAIRPLGHATAWAPTVTEADGAAGELLEILDGCYLADETDDNPERNPTPGMVPVERTTVPERLLAWRDNAVRAALADATHSAADWEDSPFLVANGTGGGYAIHARDPQYNAEPVIHAYGIEIPASIPDFATAAEIRGRLNRAARDGAQAAAVTTSRRSRS